MPEVLRFFTQMLTQQGYEVCSAIRGAAALSHAPTIEPSLILLDIMPGLDGYEVCEWLKANEKTRDIPVIFMSAIHEPLDKVRAFSVGGVDYLTKPIQNEELLVRIEHQLTLKRLQDQLRSQCSQVNSQLNKFDPTQGFWQRSLDGFYQASIDGRFLAVNRAYAALLGYDHPIYSMILVGLVLEIRLGRYDRDCVNAIVHSLEIAPIDNQIMLL